MTCIAAVVKGGIVHMAGEGVGTYGGTLYRRASAKVARRGEFVVGHTGNGRTNNLLTTFDPPAVPRAAAPDLDRFMIETFTTKLYDHLAKFHALAKTDDASETGARECFGEGGSMLVGVRSRLYLVDSFFSCSRLADQFFAVGSGGDLALGVLYELRARDLDPREKLTRALDAACYYAEGCGGEYAFVETPPRRARRPSP